MDQPVEVDIDILKNVSVKANKQENCLAFVMNRNQNRTKLNILEKIKISLYTTKLWDSKDVYEIKNCILIHYYF